MRKTFRCILLSALICIPWASNAGASGLCCQLSSGVQESLSGIAAPGTEEVSLQFNYSFTKMDAYKEGGATRSLDDAKKYLKPGGAAYTSVPLTMDMMKYTVTAGYGFSDRFKAFVSLPFVRNTMDMASSQGAMLGWRDMTMEPTSGAGDGTLMGLYRLYRNDDLLPADVLTLGIGVKTPTGSSTERSSNGKLIHAHMQPGTGSWDPLLSVIYTSMTGQFLVQADATYQYTTGNSEGYEFGDSLALGLSGKYAVRKEFNISAGLTGLYVGRASDRNGSYYNAATNSSLMDDPANTGGSSLWVSPGVQVFPRKHLALDAKVQVPLWEKVNGIQLVSSYLVVAGISYSF